MGITVRRVGRQMFARSLSCFSAVKNNALGLDGTKEAPQQLFPGE